MAKAVEVNKVTAFSEDKKGNTVFRAAGTLDGRKFVALTIQYNGEPIFKVQEGGSHQGLEGSTFDRGDRIAVARACKAERVKLFGSGAKVRVEPDLVAGETVELSAEVPEAPAPEVEEAELSDEQLVLLNRIAELDAAEAAA